MNRVMHPFRQPAKYVLSVIVVSAVIIGLWLTWYGDVAGTDSDSIAANSITGQAPGDSQRSAAAPGTPDNSSDSGGQSDSNATRTPADEKPDPAGGYFKPIPLPAEFAGLGEGQGPVSEFHQNLEREPEDPDWAVPLEREFADMLSELLDPSLIAVKLIECRSDSCEILAIGYGDQAMKEWLEMSHTLYESGMLEKWFDAGGAGPFNGGCGGVVIEPGITGLNCQFSRAAPKPEDTGNTGPFSLTAPYPDGVEYRPVPVPDDFVPLFETNSDVYDFHRALQRETVDHSWAPFIENQIAEHFLAIPELESVTYHRMECRMTRCEVQLTIHDPQTAIAWTLELKNFDNQPWNDLEFTIYNVPADDDLVRVVWLLNRKSGN